MSVVPIRTSDVATEVLDEDATDNATAELTRKCGRCRLSFVRHPSIDLDRSAKWWLCLPCRLRLLGAASQTTHDGHSAATRLGHRTRTAVNHGPGIARISG